jgi:hypothetical protein
MLRPAIVNGTKGRRICSNQPPPLLRAANNDATSRHRRCFTWSGERISRRPSAVGANDKFEARTSGYEAPRGGRVQLRASLLWDIEQTPPRCEGSRGRGTRMATWMCWLEWSLEKHHISEGRCSAWGRRACLRRWRPVARRVHEVGERSIGMAEKIREVETKKTTHIKG